MLAAAADEDLQVGIKARESRCLAQPVIRSAERNNARDRVGIPDLGPLEPLLEKGVHGVEGAPAQIAWEIAGQNGAWQKGDRQGAAKRKATEQHRRA